MRTTIDIHTPLLERAKRYASHQGKRLADVVNDALLEKLGREDQGESSMQKFRLLTFGKGGIQPGVDLSSNANLHDVVDEESRDHSGGKFNSDKMR
jgi:hypothetical protein